MRMNAKVLSGLFTSLALTACVHTADRLDTALKNWIGKHPDQLVEQWGAPRGVYVMEKGNKVLTYETSDTYSRSYGFYRRPEFYSITETCKISFFTDPSQKSIEKFSYTGTSGVCLDLIPAESSRN